MHTIQSFFAQYLPKAEERLRVFFAETERDISQYTPLSVFDTFVEEKAFITGLVIGKVNGQSISDTVTRFRGDLTISAMAECHALRYPGSPLITAGVNGVAQAVEQVRQTLRDAPNGAGILFVCANREVYEATLSALGVDHRAAKQNADQG